jgi:two-component system sensor histidine kinase YesM
MLFAFVIVTLSSILAVSLILYYNLTGSIKQNAVDYVTESMRHSDENLQIMLKDIGSMSTVVVTNQENVIDIIRSSNYEISYEWFQEQKKITSFLSTLKANKSYISRISVVGTNGKVFYEGDPRLSKDVLKDPSLQKIVDAGGTKVWIKQNGTSVLWNQTVTLGRAIQYERQTIGVVMIDLDYDVIRNVYNFGKALDGFIYVVEPDGNIVYNSNPALNAENIKDTNLSGIEKLKDGEHSSIVINGEHYLVATYTSDYTGWRTIGIIPERTLMKDSVKLRVLMIQLVIVVSILVIFISHRLSRHITKNIRRLQKAMKLVKEGNLSVISSVRSDDEIGELSSVFMEMMQQIKQQMVDIKSKEEQKREAEVTSLQAQISPHFLYNTLNTIKYLARLRNVPNIEEVTTSLIVLLRGVVGNTQRMITLDEEINNTKSYINIQKYKYIDQIETVWQVDEALLNCKIYKLTLQPIVENAIIHGLGGLESGGLLIMKVQQRGAQSIQIEVRDNGLGMTQEQIEHLLGRRDVRNLDQFSGMGINNVHERLHASFGEPYGIQIFSEPGLYTSVVITIPVIIEEEQHV